VAWFLGIWDVKPPQPIDDGFIAKMENNSSKVADWELRDDLVIAIRKGDGSRLRVYKVITCATSDSGVRISLASCET